LRIHDIRPLLEDPMKVLANLKSSVLEVHNWLLQGYILQACRVFSREGGVVRQVSSIQMAELEEASQLTHFPNMVVVACNDRCW